MWEKRNVGTKQAEGAELFLTAVTSTVGYIAISNDFNRYCSHKAGLGYIAISSNFNLYCRIHSYFLTTLTSTVATKQVVSNNCNL